LNLLSLERICIFGYSGWAYGLSKMLKNINKLNIVRIGSYITDSSLKKKLVMGF